MGSLCVIGVDDNVVLKDFVRAHVELLEGEKIVVGQQNGQFSHAGKTIRYFYSSRPVRQKLMAVLPAAFYRRLAGRTDISEGFLASALEAFFRRHKVDVILAEFGTTGARIYPHAKALGIPLIVHFHGHDAHRATVVEAHR